MTGLGNSCAGEPSGGQLCRNVFAMNPGGELTFSPAGSRKRRSERDDPGVQIHGSIF